MARTFLQRYEHLPPTAELPFKELVRITQRSSSATIIATYKGGSLYEAEMVFDSAREMVVDPMRQIAASVSER